MAKQKFTAIEREAFYRAYDGKCPYTRQSLDISSFHIDHILPEHLVNDQNALEDAKAKLEIDATFDLFGYENLTPVVPGANLLKGAQQFDPGFYRFYLAIAATKRPILEQEIRKIERHNTRSKALVMLQMALESGKLKGEEVASLLDQYSEAPEDIFKLQEKIGFANNALISEIAKSDLDQVRDKPVIGPEDSLIMDHESKEQIHVRTCREYDTAISDGYFPLGTYAIKGASIFEQLSGLLNALEHAKPAKTSFIDSPRAGVVDLYLLPFSLFPELGPSSSPEELAGTYQQKLDQGVLVVDTIRQNFLRVSKPGVTGQQLIEVARADFNGDGIEEILLFEYMWAIGGTFGAGGMRILTRKNETALFEEVEPAKKGAFCRTRFSKI